MRDPDPCQDLKNRIEFHKKLIAARTEYDLRWPHSKYPGGRHAAVNALDAITVKKLEERLKKECPNAC